MILQMAHAPPIHHVTQTVTTLNGLLICDICSCLVYCFGGWLGGWLAVQPPHPPLISTSLVQTARGAVAATFWNHEPCTRAAREDPDLSPFETGIVDGTPLERTRGHSILSVGRRVFLALRMALP